MDRSLIPNDKKTRRKHSAKGVPIGDKRTQCSCDVIASFTPFRAIPVLFGFSRSPLTSPFERFNTSAKASHPTQKLDGA